ncbi:hypothetical protein BDY19DRAFT_881710 [Irpex rosettiformis]|uniref:Uncharacterized protein n=1 Tax=Irpex rosettiformis TaxID=378272 RepID=A0ACB8UIL7_9APHY|nr:hypothetical protein BDY19DRAFT_881710 [Irpex rosettiformis]
MPLFTRSRPLTAQPDRNDEIDAFLSSEADRRLEDSFASNLSLNSPPCPRIDLPSEDDSHVSAAMDISPAPPRTLPPSKSQPYRYEEDITSPLPPVTKVATGRQRSSTTSGSQRLFGKDVSNNRSSANSDAWAPLNIVKSNDKEKATEKNGKRLQRGTLPGEWVRNAQTENTSREPGIPSSAIKPMDISSSPLETMDLDSSISSSAPEPPSPLSAAPTVTQLNFHLLSPDTPESSASREHSLSNLFYDSVSPRRRSIEGTRAPLFFDDTDVSIDTPEKPVYKKKRSLSPESSIRKSHHHLFQNVEALSSSPALASSPSVHKLERLNSRGAIRALGLGDTTKGLNANNKRPRRPALSALMAPGETGGSLRSALPQMESTAGTEEREREKADNRPSRQGLAPVRRAFSAMMPPSSLNLMDQSMESELSMDGPDMSSPAQAYAKRHQHKTIRRCDGTDDFRSMTGATALMKRDGDLRAQRKAEELQGEQQEKPAAAERNTPRSKYLTGLSGFGDNEAHGKILPCHRVREDGLMRITFETVNKLLDGKYNEQIADFQIIDCRFDYEYNGGHIDGAINVNTTQGLEEMFFGPEPQKPTPSTSGDGEKKTILVFHCEFSCKRAPTFAKHLRSKDRSVNHHVYPRIHYPEVYILEGGYCNYWKNSGERCQPRDYVRMDDPGHAASRKEDLDQFRKGKFGRTKSYAFGEGKNAVAPRELKRASASSGQVPVKFTGSNVSRSRRTNGMLQTLQEDTSATQQSEDEDTDLGDSPCPPPTKGVSFIGKKMPRAPLARAESFGMSKMTLGH